MIEIIEVKTKKEQKEFVNFPLRLYKGVSNFVPPLYGDEMKLFNNENNNKIADSVYFLAKENGKTVGRIQGIIQRQYNEIHHEKRIRFTRFDSIDKQEVADALFKALEEYALNHLLDTVCGPLGYSDLDREGLLIEGFDERSTFEEQYNFPYYQKLIENNGYEKEIDWVEYELTLPEKKDDKLKRVAERTLSMNNLHVLDSSKYSKKAYINKAKDGFFDLIDECYGKLYGVVPYTDEMKKSIIDSFMLIINKKYLLIICDENEKIVAAGLCFPGIGDALKKSGGKLTIPAIFRLLKLVKKPEVLDLGLIAVLPEYQQRGVNAVMLSGLFEMLDTSPTIKCLETNLNLETNTQVQSQWKRFNSRQHKRRRSFIKKIA